MATTTFDKKIVVSENKVVEILIKGLSENKPKEINNINIEKQLERGNSLLKQL